MADADFSQFQRDNRVKRQLHGWKRAIITAARLIDVGMGMREMKYEETGAFPPFPRLLHCRHLANFLVIIPMSELMSPLSSWSFRCCIGPLLFKFLWLGVLNRCSYTLQFLQYLCSQECIKTFLVQHSNSNIVHDNVCLTYYVCNKNTFLGKIEDTIVTNKVAYCTHGCVVCKCNDF